MRGCWSVCVLSLKCTCARTAPICLQAETITVVFFTVDRYLFDKCVNQRVHHHINKISVEVGVHLELTLLVFASLIWDWNKPTLALQSSWWEPWRCLLWRFSTRVVFCSPHPLGLSLILFQGLTLNLTFAAIWIWTNFYDYFPFIGRWIISSWLDQR